MPFGANRLEFDGLAEVFRFGVVVENCDAPEQIRAEELGRTSVIAQDVPFGDECRFPDIGPETQIARNAAGAAVGIGGFDAAVLQVMRVLKLSLCWRRRKAPAVTLVFPTLENAAGVRSP